MTAVQGERGDFFSSKIARSIVSQGLWDRWWLFLRASCSSAGGLSNLTERSRREGKEGEKQKQQLKNSNLASRIMDG